MCCALRGRRAKEPGESGAAAVEFALISPILFLLLFAIIDYGMWFSNSLGLRQGIREGARQAVVCGWSDATPSTVCDDSSMGAAADLVRTRIMLLAGQRWVKVVPLDASLAPTTTWQRGNSLLVCAVARTDGLSGLIPFPHSGYQQNSVVMRIERPMPPTLGDPELTRFEPAHADTLPAGQDWGFCHA